MELNTSEHEEQEMSAIAQVTNENEVSEKDRVKIRRAILRTLAPHSTAEHRAMAETNDTVLLGLSVSQLSSHVRPYGQFWKSVLDRMIQQVEVEVKFKLVGNRMKHTYVLTEPTLAAFIANAEQAAESENTVTAAA